MHTQEKIVVSDFDGVIGNSLEVAVKLTKKIVALIDPSEQVTSFHDYYRLLSKKSTLPQITETDSATLRDLYRLLIRYEYQQIALFDEVLNLYRQLKQPPIIVSSSNASLVLRVLQEHHALFASIHGYEKGHKREILRSMKESFDLYYITDTFRDVKICKDLGIPAIATCWGYDTKKLIQEYHPDFFAEDFAALKEILESLHLLKEHVVY